MSLVSITYIKVLMFHQNRMAWTLCWVFSFITQLSWFANWAFWFFNPNDYCFNSWLFNT